MTELHIETDYGKGLMNIWLRSKRGIHYCYYYYNGSTMIETTVEEMTAPSIDLKPFISIPVYFGNEVIKLIADHASKSGIKTEKRDFIEGELIATKKHLEDLQKAFSKLLEK